MSRPDAPSVRAEGTPTALLVTDASASRSAGGDLPGTGRALRGRPRHDLPAPLDDRGGTHPAAEGERLDRLVAIGTTDVRVHLERITYWADRGDGEGAYGALIDLFVSVRGAAGEVRNRALYWAREVLDDEHYRALAEVVNVELGRDAPFPPTSRAVRALGVVGTRVLVADDPPTLASAVTTPAPSIVLHPRLPGSPTTTAAELLGGPAAQTAPAGWFDPDRTVLGALRRHAGFNTEFTLRGAFGRIEVRAAAVWFNLTDGAAQALSTTEFTDLVDVRHVEPHRVNRRGSRTLDAATWDLATMISAGRLPLGLPVDDLLRLRRQPEWRHVQRIDGDIGLAARLTDRAARVDDLPATPAARTFLAAAWLTGMLAVVSGDARSGSERRAAPAGLLERVRGRSRA